MLRGSASYCFRKDHGYISMSEFQLKVFKLFDHYDIQELLIWWFDEDRLFLGIDVSDFFFWGCSDYEEITEDNLDRLASTLRYLDENYEFLNAYGPKLFVARERKCRPQGASYPRNEIINKLFNECGPPREIVPGNPQERK